MFESHKTRNKSKPCDVHKIKWLGVLAHENLNRNVNFKRWPNFWVLMFTFKITCCQNYLYQSVSPKMIFCTFVSPWECSIDFSSHEILYVCWFWHPILSHVSKTAFAPQGAVQVTLSWQQPITRILTSLWWGQGCHAGPTRKLHPTTNHSLLFLRSLYSCFCFISFLWLFHIFREQKEIYLLCLVILTKFDTRYSGNSEFLVLGNTSWFYQFYTYITVLLWEPISSRITHTHARTHVRMCPAQTRSLRMSQTHACAERRTPFILKNHLKNHVSQTHCFYKKS